MVEEYEEAAGDTKVTGTITKVGCSAGPMHGRMGDQRPPVGALSLGWALVGVKACWGSRLSTNLHRLALEFSRAKQFMHWPADSVRRADQGIEAHTGCMVRPISSSGHLLGE